MGLEMSEKAKPSAVMESIDSAGFRVLLLDSSHKEVAPSLRTSGPGEARCRAPSRETVSEPAGTGASEPSGALGPLELIPAWRWPATKLRSFCQPRAAPPEELLKPSPLVLLGTRMVPSPLRDGEDLCTSLLNERPFCSLDGTEGADAGNFPLPTGRDTVVAGTTNCRGKPEKSGSS